MGVGLIKWAWPKFFRTGITITTPPFWKSQIHPCISQSFYSYIFLYSTHTHTHKVNINPPQTCCGQALITPYIHSTSSASLQPAHQLEYLGVQTINMTENCTLATYAECKPVNYCVQGGHVQCSCTELGTSCTPYEYSWKFMNTV